MRAGAAIGLHHFTGPNRGHTAHGVSMPRYLGDGTFNDGLLIPTDDAGTTTCSTVVGTNTGLGVTWVHSCVTQGQGKTFCMCDEPDGDAIRTAAEKNGLPRRLDHRGQRAGSVLQPLIGRKTSAAVIVEASSRGTRRAAVGPPSPRAR